MNTNLITLLKKCREQRGLSLATLGDLAGGITPQHLHEIEKGEIDPRLSTLEKIAKVLKCKIELVIPDDESDNDYLLSSKAKRRIKKSPFITINLTDDDWRLFEKNGEDDTSRATIVKMLNEGLQQILSKPNATVDEIRRLVQSLPEESYGASDDAFKIAIRISDYLGYELIEDAEAD